MNIPIKVLVADDHAIVRNGIISLLEVTTDIEVVAESANGVEALQSLKEALSLDIIIINLELFIQDGTKLSNEIQLLYPDLKVIILTTQDDDKTILKCFAAGAKGYLLKNISAAEMIFAIKQVFIGYEYISSSIGLKLLNQRISPTKAYNNGSKLNISIREIEILNLIADGFTNSEIADRLFTSKRTIEGNRQSLLDKTGKRNTAALINFAVRNGIID